MVVELLDDVVDERIDALVGELATAEFGVEFPYESVDAFVDDVIKQLDDQDLL